MTTKTKWEKTARGARLVRTTVLGTTSKLKRGVSWKRSDGHRGKAKSERAARAAVAGAPGALARALQQSSPKAKAKPAQTRPRAITADALYDEAAKLPTSARFHRNVFLAPLLARFGTTPQAAKAQLLALHQGDQITLTRADLVDAMDPKMVRDSEVVHSGARFHLLAPRGW